MSVCLNPKEFSAVYLVDVNSAIRNSTAAVSACKEIPKLFSTTLIGASAALGGTVGVPLGLCITKEGLTKVKASLQYGDWEGVLHQSLWSTVGLGYAGAAGVLASAGFFSLANQPLPAVINPAFAGLCFPFYGALLGYGAYGYFQTRKFGEDLKCALASGTEFDFLKSQLTLSSEEIKTLSPEQREKLLQKKWNQFELRTNAKISALVREKLPELLEKRDAKVLQELVFEVQKANYKEKIKHLILIASAVIGILASVFLLISTGPASPLFFAIGAALWLTVDSSALHEYIGESLASRVFKP